jgi:streptogramin lyase
VDDTEVELAAPTRRNRTKIFLSVGAALVVLLAAIAISALHHDNDASLALRKGTRAHPALDTPDGSDSTDGTLAAGERTEPRDATTTAPQPTTTHGTPTTILPGGDSEPVVTTVPVVPDPLVREFAAGDAGSEVSQIAAGPNHDLWFTIRAKGLDAGEVGRITVDGKVTRYGLSLPQADPTSIALGPDGAMWFTEYAGAVGRATEDGTITETPSCCAFASGLTATPDGGFLVISFDNLYHLSPTFDAQLVYGIGGSTVNGVAPMFVDHAGRTWMPRPGGLVDLNVAPVGPVSYSATPTVLWTGSDTPELLAQVAGDDALWFACTRTSGSSSTRHIDRVVIPQTFENYQALSVTSFDVPGQAPLNALVGGPDGNLWFTQGNHVGRMTAQGKVTFFAASAPTSLAAGPDGNMWFTESGGQIGRIDLSQL